MILVSFMIVDHGSVKIVDLTLAHVHTRSRALILNFARAGACVRAYALM